MASDQFINNPQNESVLNQLEELYKTYESYQISIQALKSHIQSLEEHKKDELEVKRMSNVSFDQNFEMQ